LKLAGKPQWVFQTVGVNGIGEYEVSQRDELSQEIEKALASGHGPNFDTMNAALAKDIQDITDQQRAMAASAETYLHLTADTTRQNIPARALWVAAPLSEKQTVQSVLFPDRALGFLHQLRMNWKLLFFKSLLELTAHPEAYEGMVGLGGLEPPTSPLSGARSSHLSYRPD
jgi:hypothetical protein